MERVSKFIANSGYASRRKVDELIKEGKVLVNGDIAKLGQKVSGNDIITIDGKIINSKEKNYLYFLVNKPRGVITTTNDPEGRKIITDLVDCKERIYPIGRLDYDTTGAILLTNDGELTNLLSHPKNNIDKTYLAKLEGIIDVGAINKLKRGIKIDNYKTTPSRVKLKKVDKKTNTCLVEIVIHEGHNHQVKKMFEEVGYNVIRLTRLSFAGLNVKNLKSGEYRSLSLKEVQRLYSLGK